jgi:hypothetical protein
VNYPDTPEHWVICSAEFLAAMALFGEWSIPIEAPKTVKVSKPFTYKPPKKPKRAK